MIYAVIKRYEHDGVKFAEFTYKPTETTNIYSLMMRLTNGDHEISCDAASWCELATEGEIYEFTGGEIEMQLID